MLHSLKEYDPFDPEESVAVDLLVRVTVNHI
jgi:hypothetical protein